MRTSHKWSIFVTVLCASKLIIHIMLLWTSYIIDLEKCQKINGHWWWLFHLYWQIHLTYYAWIFHVCELLQLSYSCYVVCFMMLDFQGRQLGSWTLDTSLLWLWWKSEALGHNICISIFWVGQFESEAGVQVSDFFSPINVRVKSRAQLKHK